MFLCSPEGCIIVVTRKYPSDGSRFTPYYPGVGISLGMYDYTHSLGTTLQLHYRFAGRKGNH